MNDPRRHRQARWLAPCAVVFGALVLGCGARTTDELANRNNEELQDTNPTSGQEAEPPPELEWALAIHGGAGSASRAATDAEDHYQALRNILSLGVEQLAAGEASLQVVENVVAALEDDPRFNAGRGAVFTFVGTHEMDAAIMDGRSLAAGAVANVKNVRNPVRLARRVMEDTPHVFLGGPGADDYGVVAGVRRQPQAYFTTERQLEAYRRIRNERTRNRPPRPSADAPEASAREPDGGGAPESGEETSGTGDAGNAGGADAAEGVGGASHLGTVGAVALDRYGNVAAATSTGGTMYKRIGRIGDVPVIGAGTYANNETAAISGTGRGEEFIRHVVAKDVAARMEYAGLSLEESARLVIQDKLQPGDGGLIAVDGRGTIAMEFNTNAMFRGAANSLGRFDVAIWDEVQTGQPAPPP